MARFIFANNALTTLASGLTAVPGSNVATLAAGTGAMFPDPASGDQFALTFIDAATGLSREIVYVTDRVGDTITFVRAQEGSTIRAWSPGDIAAELWTAGQAAANLQIGDSQQQNNNYAEGANVTGGANNIVAALSPALIAPINGMPIRVKIKFANTAAVTLDPGHGPTTVRRMDGSELVGGEFRVGDIIEFKYNGSQYRVARMFPARDADITAGTDTQTAVTPAQLANALGQSGSAPAYGLIYSRTTAQNILITAGAIGSDDRTTFMVGAQLTKQTSANWTAGNNGGLLATDETVADGDFFLFIIKNPTTGAVDYISSASLTAPTLPAGFTKKRLIGWYRRASSQTVPFHVYELPGGGIEFSWDTPILDVDIVDVPTDSRRLDALSVPNGIQVIANINASLRTNSIDGNSMAINICCPDQADDPPSFSAGPLGNVGGSGAFSSTSGLINGWTQVQLYALRVRTNTSKQIAARSSRPAETSLDLPTYRVATLGFEMTRR